MKASRMTISPRTIRILPESDYYVASRRLPGSTCREGIEPLRPAGVSGLGDDAELVADFAGGGGFAVEVAFVRGAVVVGAPP